MTPLAVLAFYAIGIVTGALWTLAFMRAKVARMEQAWRDSERARDFAMRSTDAATCAAWCSAETQAAERFQKECR